MENNYISRFEKILGRKLSHEELSRIQNTKEVLQIADTDALWDIIICFEYYKTICQEVPAKMELVLNSHIKAHSVNPAPATRAKDIKQSKILFLLLCVIIYGLLAMFCGYGLAIGKVPELGIFQFPAGYLISCLCMCASMYYVFQGVQAIVHNEKKWIRELGIALLLFIAGLLIFVV